MARLAAAVSPEAHARRAACGAEAAPCKSVQTAADNAGAGGTVALTDSAPFYLSSSVLLTSKHSGLTLTAAPNAK